MNTQHFFERYRFLLLAAFALLAPFALLGAIKAMGTNANDVRKWLPTGLPETDEYAEFVRHFGSEEFVAVSWEGCTLDDPRLGRLAGQLAPANIAGRTAAVDKTDPRSPRNPWIASVITGPQAMEELMAPPAKLTREEALTRLQGLLVGPDGVQASAIVRPTELGKSEPRKLLASIRRAAIDVGVPDGSLRMGGPPVTSTAVDDAAASSMAAPGPLSVLVALVVSWMCFRSLRLTLPAVAIGVFSAAAALAVLWFSHGEMNAVLLSMPPLVYVATTSGAIHWANYYREAVAEGGAAGAAGRAVLRAWLPLVLATATTSMGLLSLCASDLLPIRQFGLYAAIGVSASLLWLLVVLPAVSTLWPLPAARPHAVPRPGWWESMNWWTWGQRVVRNQLPITLICVVVVMSCGWGVWRMRTTVSVEEFFARDAELPTTSRWLETRLGGMVPMELVVRFDAESHRSMLERMEVVDRVQRRVARLPNVSTSVSAATFGPVLPESPAEGWSLRRSVFNRKLERQRGQLLSSGFLALDQGAELWRISLRTRSFHQVDQRYFIDTVRESVEPLMVEERARGGDQVSAAFTGMVPLVNRAQQSLLEGLSLGLATDLVLIIVTVIVLMRHWSAGLLMLAACVPPSLIVLGLLGWTGVTLDVGSVLAPSVAIGVSVDDVLHFILWFRRGLLQGLDRTQAVRLAYAGCARAMFQSWGVIGLGLGIFAFSDFTPTHRFGVLMFCLVSVGLVVNLVLLPALLAGFLGRRFARGLGLMKAGPRIARPELEH